MSKTFNPQTDIPSQTGRVLFITGGTTGLGAESITLLAAHNPAHIYFTGRNASRATTLLTTLRSTSPSTKFTFLECDHSSLSSVQTAAQQFVAQESRLDLLMCNAGVMILPPSLSKDGYEIQFAINHLSHALFAKLLLPTMLKTAAETPNADVRIISLSSTAHSAAPSAGIEFENLSTDQSSCGPFFVPSKFARYGQSKLANLVYPMALAKHYPSITSVAVHPGFVRTALHDSEGMFDKILVNTARKGEWLKPEQGAHTQLWAATTAKKGLVNGAYYEPIGVKVVPGLESARDGVLAERLWEWTEKALARFA